MSHSADTSRIFNGPRPAGRPWFSFRDAGETEPVEIMIYDQIGKDWWDDSGIDAKSFADQLKTVPRNREILMRINSPGGNVHDGLAIYNLLRDRRDHVVSVIDGIAASIASVIALAGREVRMPRNALFMIHDPSALVEGTSRDLRAMADALDAHRDSISSVYELKTGRTPRDINAKMAAETWFTGQEARDYGLADVVTDEITVTASFDLSSFRNFPGALRTNQQTNPSAVANGTQQMRNKIIALLKKHGIKVNDDASDEQLGTLLGQLEQSTDIEAIRNEIKELKAKLATPPSPAPQPAPVAAVTPEQFAALQAQLAAERERRITHELDAILADRPFIDRAEWLPRVLKDETLLATLRTFAPAQTGAEPIRLGSAQNNGNPLLEDYKKLTAGAKRNSFRVPRISPSCNASAGSSVRAIMRTPSTARCCRIGSLTVSSSWRTTSLLRSARSRPSSP